MLQRAPWRVVSRYISSVKEPERMLTSLASSTNGTMLVRGLPGNSFPDQSCQIFCQFDGELRSSRTEYTYQQPKADDTLVFSSFSIRKSFCHKSSLGTEAVLRSAILEQKRRPEKRFITTAIQSLSESQREDFLQNTSNESS